MLDFLCSAQKELAGITRGEQREKELENLINEAKAEAVEKAADLTKSRKIASEKLEKAVGAELEFLNMPGVKFLSLIHISGRRHFLKWTFCCR